MNNVRIAIRDSTDSHSVGFFDNVAGIKYKKAEIQRFLAGSASVLTLKYNSKDIDSIRSGCKLAFRYKARDYWLNIMKFEKQGFEVEITACSLHLEMNNEERGAHKPDKAMSFAEYLAYYDPEHSVTLGINQVSDKKIKLEWTGTDTILARLFSIANSFDAELEFVTELNDDYSLKRHVLNVYKKGNLGSNKTSTPVRVGKELKVINYSDSIEDLRTAVRATGKDGLTIDGLNKKIYDDNKELLYYSSGMTVYAPQSRDRFPSVGKGSNDNWIIEDLGETQYETKEALWGYMYGEIQKICLPKIEYKVTGAIDSDVGDTQTLIDDVHYEPPLYLKARVSELTDDILQGKVIDSTFINFERQYSQIADSLLKQVEALAEDAAPYIIRLSTDNGYNFKNSQGSSTITAKLEKYSKIVNADWKWLINNSVVSETSSVTINASQVTGTLNVVAVASVDGNEVSREYITFTNSDDGVGIKSIKRYYTTNDQSEGVTTGGQNWSTKPTTVTADKNYMWSYDVITYTNDTSLVTEPAVIGARGDDGLDADTTGITEALDKAKQELTALSANIEKVRDDSLAAVEEAKQQLATVANDLSKAKTNLQNAVSAVDVKATNLQSDLTTAKQDLQAQASQLTAQASAQSELTKRVSSVEETANGTKTTVSELSKTVAQNGKDITSVTTRTKTVEDDLANTKTTLTATTTTANSASQKAATLETGLNGLTAKFTNLSVGNKNYLPASRVVNRGATDFSYDSTNKKWTMSIPANRDTWGKGIYFNTDNLNIALNGGETLFFGMMIKANKTCSFIFDINNYLSGSDSNDNDERSKAAWYPTNKTIPANTWTRVWFSYTAKDNVPIRDSNSNFGITGNTETVDIELKEVIIAKSNVPVDYQMPDADIEQKVAEYKQTADQNYASLQTTVQNLDGTVQQNKTIADQTAQGFSTRIESLETYKDGENARANQYFESAKTETARQLTAERTAIAKDYVAKSTYTSDVTGIRNDLSATTTTANATKTNLANYQASNDKMVASLKSSLQTTDGNVSNLQTKVEAVPGKITSAVSAVEGKIPKSVNTVNLIKNTDKPFTMGYGITNTTWDDDKKWAYLDLTDPNVSTAKAGEILPQGQFYNFKPTKGMTYTQSILIDTDATFNPNGQPENSWFTSQGHNKKRGYFEQLSETTYRFWSTCTWELEDIELRAFDWYELHTVLNFRNSGTYLAFYKPKLTTGTLPSDWSPAPEDTVGQISSLSSQIQQTADGMTLLATKTELNTAKSDLQSGITTATSKADNAQATANNNAQTISTHTTQISALNTGLQAKVSKSDFDSLSGRVTTAENNITATANELSSKITSVEGKIPKSVGGANLFKGSRDFSGTDWVNKNSGIYAEDYQGVKIFKKQTLWGGVSQYFEVKTGEEYVFSAYVKSSAKTDGIIFFLVHSSKQPQALGVVSFDSTNSPNAVGFDVTDEYQRIAIKIKITEDGWIMPRLERYNSDAYLFFGGYKLERGNIPTDWSPAPEDYDSKLATAQSEIKQTTDAITASVSSVQTTASNAQSTANTAVSKADAAQAGVNTLDSTTVKSASLTINTDGIVMKAGKSTTDVANAIGSYFAVNQNAINLFSDKIKVKGDMIVDGSITADKFKGNQITSLNGATTLNLYTGEIIFNNQYATINQIKGSYKSQISLFSLDNGAVNESAWSSVNTLAFNSTKLTSATRRAGSAVDMFPNFSLMTLYGEKIAFTGETSGAPGPQNAIIVNTNSDEVNFTNSQTNSSKGAWNYSMIMNFGANAAISAPDIKLAGHFKSLTGILDDLCKKVGIMWI